MPTNYEWLLNMDGEERQAWFDAEHVDANDDLAPKSDVIASDVDANDGFMDLDSCTHGMRTFASETDSREKLEADIRAYRGAPSNVVNMIPVWIDRAFTIAERECLVQSVQGANAILTAENAELQKRIATQKRTIESYKGDARELQEQVDRLTAERDALSDDLLTCNHEREHLRKSLGIALDHAHDMLSLVDISGEVHDRDEGLA